MRWFAGFVFLALTLGCAAPGRTPDAAHGALPPSVPAASQARRSTAPTVSVQDKLGHARLRVGTSGDYAPFSFRDATGTLRGFDPEIATAMAGDLGLELEWVGFRWPTLEAQLQNGEFDVAMGGVTWQPTRAVRGYLTRALVRGGPCVLGDEQAARLAVNRGGVLEAWARAHFAGRELVTVDENQTLPGLLESGRAGAIVTDSFERKAFEKPGWKVRCEPSLWRKVYWLAPGQEQLAARVEDWLRSHSARIESAQQRWFGERQPLDAMGNLSDLLARRMAFMPLVAGAKAKLGLPIEDLPREKVVLDSAAASARKVGLPEAATHDFFALQIELSKAVQRRSSDETRLDLAQQIRPALSELGDRILAAVVEARSAGQLTGCSISDLQALSPWLTSGELEQLLGALQALGR
ncbi:MAG: transporter substrate-binding domain-containing protein [Myxococcales bacterium]